MTLGVADAPSATGLAELVYPKRAEWNAVAAEVAREAARRWAVPNGPGALPEAIRARATSLVARYADPAWTWRR